MSRRVYRWRVSPPPGSSFEVVEVLGASRYEAMIAAAKLWRTPWTPIARACAFEKLGGGGGAVNMTPLLIVKINTIKPSDALARDMETIAEGIKKGCLVLSGDCEVIAFDGEGRLAYPIKREEAAQK